MIYCGSGSGSYFGKVFVPAPVPVQHPDLFSTVFQQQTICTKSCFFIATSRIVSQTVRLASNFLFFDFNIPFYVGSGPDTGMPVTLRQKFAIPAVPVPVLVPVPQH
jgi:hypothetical protein